MIAVRTFSIDIGDLFEAWVGFVIDVHGMNYRHPTLVAHPSEWFSAVIGYPRVKA